MEYKDYYKILGISKNAAHDDIHRAYRKLARKYHPDVSKAKDAEAKFREINEAKEVLQDPEKKKLYDTYGKDWEQAGQQSPPQWGQGAEGGSDRYSQSYSHFSNGETAQGTDDFSEFFKNLFGGESFRGSSGGRGDFFSAPGESHEAQIQVELRDVFYGATRTIKFQVFKAFADGHVKPHAKTLQVKIPKGVTNGSVIRLTGQGGKGSGGGIDGDLLLTVTVLPDPDFHVVGHNLHTSIGVSPWEVILGAKIPIKTIDGNVNLIIPAYSQNGQRFRLKGLGIPKKGDGAGDIIIEIDIRLPQSLRDEEKRLVEELSRISSFNARNEQKRPKRYAKT